MSFCDRFRYIADTIASAAMCVVWPLFCSHVLCPPKKPAWRVVLRGWEKEASFWVQEGLKKVARVRSVGCLFKLVLGLALVADVGEAGGEGRKLVEVCYTANLYDSYGDSWNGNKLTIQDSDTGATVQELTQSGSIAMNTAESFSVCVDGCNCFTGQAGGGTYTAETSWNIEDGAGVTVAAASSSTSASFCTACMTVCEEGKQPNAEDNGCEECVAGKFSDTTGVAACTDCADGSSSTVAGSASADDCQQVRIEL